MNRGDVGLVLGLAGFLLGGYAVFTATSTKGDVDDGKNFLRIERPDPLGITYWEVGNEVYGNGYYANGTDDGFELDMHVPYDGTKRLGHPALSGTTYGKGVVECRAVEARDNHCGPCRACWDRRVRVVSYPQH